MLGRWNIVNLSQPFRSPQGTSSRGSLGHARRLKTAEVVSAEPVSPWVVVGIVFVGIAAGVAASATRSTSRD